MKQKSFDFLLLVSPNFAGWTDEAIKIYVATLYQSSNLFQWINTLFYPCYQTNRVQWYQIEIRKSVEVLVRNLNAFLGCEILSKKFYKYQATSRKVERLLGFYGWTL